MGITVSWLIKEVEGEGEVAQSCPTLCNLVDCSLPGFSVHGIPQARILEWVTISFSRGSSWPRDWTRVSRIGGRRFNLCTTNLIINNNMCPKVSQSASNKRFRSNPFWHLFLESFIETATFTAYTHSFHTTTTELKSCDRNLTIHKACTRRFHAFLT